MIDCKNARCGQFKKTPCLTFSCWRISGQWVGKDAEESCRSNL